ncbi:hypothetical protein OG746_40830 [Streptomyces sp. NBC_01016]|uniref:hypothetical protein n=1 Tax=Streptomyces sp. NBC_01016 TaxID=2903720 RepID=UPI002253C682|nr:hypothetical protein [Streptomyces sp. NBC_01016]MCX4835050.1 hypothetical protein [Streptomyces sp. NBC_01016]
MASSRFSGLRGLSGIRGRLDGCTEWAILATLPLLVVYVIARRQLVSGLTAGFGK